jgi:N-acetylglucosamine-6-phosphate deacetylase
MSRLILAGADVFDGSALLRGHAVVIDGEQISDITPTPPQGERVVLDGGILAPGMIDLQVNGGGGQMVGAGTGPQSLRALCDIHASLGATGILPTLITDTPETTAAVISAGYAAARAGIDGFLGLHLEGPHLDRARKGAHDPALIRPMTAQDLAQLCEAARYLPALMVTLAPAAVTPEQIATLVQAGVIVSLGHAECSFEQAQAAHRAGARAITHLFNAMSGLGHREPGLVGAALTLDFDVGLIADGHHVHPRAIALALAAKRAGRVFLVSDAMAVAGTALHGFELAGRAITRGAGRLQLADGTLAGADLSLPQAVAVMVHQVGLPAEQALAMATCVPAAVIGQDHRLGHLRPGRRADMVHLAASGEVKRVWRAGQPVAGPGNPH